MDLFTCWLLWPDPSPHAYTPCTNGLLQATEFADLRSFTSELDFTLTPYYVEIQLL